MALRQLRADKHRHPYLQIRQIRQNLYPISLHSHRMSVKPPSDGFFYPPATPWPTTHNRQHQTVCRASPQHTDRPQCPPQSMMRHQGTICLQPAPYPLLTLLPPLVTNKSTPHGKMTQQRTHGQRVPMKRCVNSGIFFHNLSSKKSKCF